MEYGNALTQYNRTPPAHILNQINSVHASHPNSLDQF